MTEVVRHRIADVMRDLLMKIKQLFIFY